MVTIMRTVRFEEIKDSLINQMHRNSLVPIIGSGFTRNCRAQLGKVPSGDDYKTKMIEQICISKNIPETDEETRTRLNNLNFSKISSIYHNVVDKSVQISYISKNFIGVVLPENKKDFLRIQWPYIYTLNIDDAIEQNSRFKNVFFANRQARESAFNAGNCLIKLHGDAPDMTKYADSKGEIFTQEQYVTSLKENKSLLKRLEHDLLYQNVIYIGCSLDDEIDLLYCTSEIKTQISRYYCTTTNPDFIQESNLKNYGISEVIIFDSFDQIYDLLVDAADKAAQIEEGELENYKDYVIKQLDCSFETNYPYFLLGDKLIGADRTIYLPGFFIQREITSQIIEGIDNCTIQAVVGGGCSGKTYIMIDIICRVRDRSVFAFQSSDRISEDAFLSLLNNNNSLILFDSKVLESWQIEKLIQERMVLKNRGISIVLFSNKSSRELYGILKLYEMENRLGKKEIPRIEVSNKFSAAERSSINPMLTTASIGIIKQRESIIDSIMRISDSLEKQNKYYKKHPATQTKEQIAALIVFAIEKKIYSTQAVRFGILTELLEQVRYLSPLLEAEVPWDYEYSLSDNATEKYVLNAEYWLFNQLGELTKTKKKRFKIVDAYRYIISQIIAYEGKPDLHRGKLSSYRNLINFDYINHIFYSRRGGEIYLIKEIYESLSDLLSTDPNFMHQRAKCFLQLVIRQIDKKDKKDLLDKAYRDAQVSLQIFEERYDKDRNEKLLISADHVKYTLALIQCNRCLIHQYKDIDENSRAVSSLLTAIVSPHNSYDFIKVDSLNRGNIVKKTVLHFIKNKSLVYPSYYYALQTLFAFISE